MRLLDYFCRRPDGRCEPLDDLPAIERQPGPNPAAQKAIRNEPAPRKRWWLTRKLKG